MSDELLSREDFQLLRMLPKDLELSYSAVNLRPENKADGECMRREARDRLKPYVEKKNPSDKGLMARVINTFVAQNEAIKADKLMLDKATSAYFSLMQKVSHAVDCAVDGVIQAPEVNGLRAAQAEARLFLVELEGGT